MAHRIIRDVDGLEWQVWETRPTGTRLAVSRGYADGWLAFERVAEPGGPAPMKHRLAPIPEGWAELSEQDLLKLLTRAQGRPHPDRRPRRPTGGGH